MSVLQNKPGHIDICKGWSESGGLGGNHQTISLTIKRANTINLAQVFKYYGVDINEFNKKICCPFKFHKDNSPSFYYYPETNSFNCFGCKSAGNPVNFVSLIEDINKLEAANKLLNNFDS